MLDFFKKEKVQNIVVALVIIAIISAFFVVAYFRVNGFLLTSGDSAVAEQALWNSVHGDWFYQSSLIGVSNNFREHLNFIQFLFLPFYALATNILTLYVVINLMYGIAAFILFRFAKEKLGTLAAFIFALFFLLQPIAIIQNVDTMHVVAVGAPLLLLTFIFYEQKKYKWWLVFMLATCFVTEFIAPTIFIFGVLALWDRRSAKWIVPPVIASVAMYAASVWYIKIGYSKNDSILKSFSNISNIDHFGIRFGRIKQFLSPALYFLPFFSKYVFFLVPTILVDIYVADINRLYVGSHLLSLVPPILVIALYDIAQKNSLMVRKIMLGLMVVGILYSASVWTKMLDVTPNDRASTMREAVSWVKDDGSVTTARIMGIALNHRKDFYLLDNQKLSDYMIFDRQTGEYSNKLRMPFNDSVEKSGNYLKVMDKNDIAVYISNERVAKLLHMDEAGVKNTDPSVLVNDIGNIK